MNRRQKRNLQKKNLRGFARKKRCITSERELLTESNTECEPCRYFEICMERRGKCRDFVDYEAVKQKVREEIENLRKGTAFV